MRRIPRPLGTTNLAKQENKEKLIQHVINNYILNGFTLNKKHYNLEELSTMLNIDTSTIHLYINNSTSHLSGLLNPGSLQDSIRALQNIGLNWALSDRGLIAQQLTTMQAAQGSTYKPFISGTVNQSLKLMLESTKGLQGMISSITGPQGSTVNILNHTNPNALEGPIADNLLTTDKALLMIKEEGINTLREDTDKQKALFAKHGIDETPEVNANLQGGSAEDLVPKLKVMESEGPIAEEVEFEDHTNRREAEYRVSDKDDSIG